MNQSEFVNEEEDDPQDPSDNPTSQAADHKESALQAEKASPAARKLEPIVLAHVLRPNYQPVKPRVIAKQLQLSKEQLPALKICLKRLVKQGKIMYGREHLVRAPGGKPKSETLVERPAKSPEKARPGSNPNQQPPAQQHPIHATKHPTPPPHKRTAMHPAAEASDDQPDAETITPQRAKEKKRASTLPHKIAKGEVIGKFRRAAAGFGFVRPAGTPRGNDRSGDIFIPQKSARDAASGDLVRVRLSRSQGRSKGGEMRQAGEIVDVLERDTHQFVGTYRERDGEAFIEIDGKTFGQPVPLGDPGAKIVQPGDKVVVEMVRFPSPAHAGEAVITEVLGARGLPGVDTLSILREFGLPDQFPEEVLQASRDEADKFDESIGKRLDLTGETIVTIDPVDARDFDDAISLKRLENGHWWLGVHIADVSHFVRQGSVLDEEAKDRATSIYLPDRVIPMLPEVISNNLASLQPNKVRYAQTCFIEFSPEGTVMHTEWHKSAIKSCHRFTYEDVDAYLADRKAWLTKLTPQVHQIVADMHELAMMLRARRLRLGAVELALPEVKIDLDRSGKVTGAHLVVNTESHQMIEEFMLAANEAVARILFAKKVPFLRRIHELPSPKKLHALTDFVRELGMECDSLENRFEIKRILAEVAGQPESHAVNYAVLRSMQKAVYSPVEEGHYALHSQQYCHFTSPIRRYPDLTVHRALEAIHRGKKPKEGFEELVLLGDHCSEREQRAQIAERELTKVKLLTYLSEKIGLEMSAVITGVEDFGIFAQGVELPAEGLIAVQTLADDRYRYDARAHSLIGYREGNSFRLGDVIRVEVARVDVDKRELDFRVVGRGASAPKKKGATKERDKRESFQRDHSRGKGKGKGKRRG